MLTKVKKSAQALHIKATHLLKVGEFRLPATNLTDHGIGLDLHQLLWRADMLFSTVTSPACRKPNGCV